MNVEQVIKELQKFPPEMEVRVWGGSDCDVEWKVDRIVENDEWTGPDAPPRKFVLIE